MTTGIRRISEWPLVGPIVRLCISIAKLPELHAAIRELKEHGSQPEAKQLPDLLDTFSDLNQRQHTFETKQLPTLLQSFADLKQRLIIFESQQLPSLLKTFSDSQLATDNDRNNLVRSVPVALRRLTREISEIAHRSESHEGRVIGLENRSLSLEGRVIELETQLNNTWNSIPEIYGRIEFVRRELMFEIRYGASRPVGGGEQSQTTTEVLSPEKVAAARKHKVKLNLGCGHIPLEGYLNVDRRSLPGVDIVAEVDALPFEPGELDEIFSAHFLEHFPQEQLRRQLLPYFLSLLKQGGEFHAVVPDAKAMIREYSSGEYPYDDFREVMYGGQDYDGDFHFNMFTPESLSKLLIEAGFEDVQLIDQARKNGACYEFELKAKRP